MSRGTRKWAKRGEKREPKLLQKQCMVHSLWGSHTETVQYFIARCAHLWPMLYYWVKSGKRQLKGREKHMDTTSLGLLCLYMVKNPRIMMLKKNIFPKLHIAAWGSACKQMDGHVTHYLNYPQFFFPFRFPFHFFRSRLFCDNHDQLICSWILMCIMSTLSGPETWSLEQTLIILSHRVPLLIRLSPIPTRAINWKAI